MDNGSLCFEHGGKYDDNLHHHFIGRRSPYRCSVVGFVGPPDHQRLRFHGDPFSFLGRLLLPDRMDEPNIHIRDPASGHFGLNGVSCFLPISYPVGIHFRHEGPKKVEAPVQAIKG